MKALAKLLCAVTASGLLGCSEECRLSSEQMDTYLGQVCGCNLQCMNAVAEFPVQQTDFSVEVCVAKLSLSGGAPVCCGTNFTSRFCDRARLGIGMCEGEDVLLRYTVDRGSKGVCEPVEFKLPVFDDATTGGSPVLVAATSLSGGEVNHCAVLDLRRSVRTLEDSVILHGHTLDPLPGFDPPPACPNAVQGPALNDPPPDGGI